VDGGGELVAGDVGHNVEEKEEETDVAWDLGHNLEEEEEEVTDGPLGPAVVGKAMEGDGDAIVWAALLGTAGPAGPSVVDKVCVCVCTCPPVLRGGVLITQYESPNLTPDDIPSIPWAHSTTPPDTLGDLARRVSNY
jgi:hypothetical protein